MKILKFNTKWCSPCKAMTPSYQLLKEEFNQHEYLDVDCEENLDLVTQYEILGVPFFVVLDKEVEVLRTNNLDKLKELLQAETDWL